MKDSFFISDLHLGHKNIIQYTRPQFKDLDEMTEHIIQKWNAVVKPTDRVYIVGDVVWRKSELPLLNQFNGKKVLYKGNHDSIAKASEYLEYFEDIRGCEFKWIPGFGKVLIQHIPAHPGQFERARAQIHGHTHTYCLEDTRFFNVSCEVIDFTPIHLEEIGSRLISILGPLPNA